jgi:NitT/TauT family transport system ATP-binding protein
VLLVDRVVIMASHPGGVHEIVVINIPRPRVDPIAIHSSEEFTQKRYHIWKTLQTANTPEEIEAHTEVF